MPDTSGVSNGLNNLYNAQNYGRTGQNDGSKKTEEEIQESVSTNPYKQQVYSHASTDMNTLNITDYFKLLSAQLANQDMNDPMSNSEMMAQMVQMAMVQSMTSMNEVMENMISSMETSQIISTQTYAAALVGQEVTVSVTETKEDGSVVAVGTKTGVVTSVNFTSATPTFRLEGDDTDYPITHLLGMGEVKVEIPKPDEEEDGDKEEEGTGGVTDGEDNNGSGETGGVTGGGDVEENKPTEPGDTDGTGTTGDTTGTEGVTGESEGTGSAEETENAAGTGAADISGSVNTDTPASAEDDNIENTEKMGIAV